ncbi:MAG: hypothetical protein HXS44_17275 [Theionarchaea archaeon]|nr:hypothetical protein [Theionarchaea archaeon]
MILILGSSGFTALIAAFGLSLKGYSIVQTFSTALGCLGIVLLAIGGLCSFGTTAVRPTRTIMPGAVSAAKL